MLYLCSKNIASWCFTVLFLTHLGRKNLSELPCLISKVSTNSPWWFHAREDILRWTLRSTKSLLFFNLFLCMCGMCSTFTNDLNAIRAIHNKFRSGRKHSSHKKAKPKASARAAQGEISRSPSWLKFDILSATVRKRQKYTQCQGEILQYVCLTRNVQQTIPPILKRQDSFKKPWNVSMKLTSEVDEILHDNLITCWNIHDKAFGNHSIIVWCLQFTEKKWNFRSFALLPSFILCFFPWMFVAGSVPLHIRKNWRHVLQFDRSKLTFDDFMQRKGNATKWIKNDQNGTT